VLILWGNPIYVDKKADRDTLEAKKRELETSLTELTEQADRMACGK